MASMAGTAVPAAIEAMCLLKSATQARYGLPINDATTLSVDDVLRMVTSGGARALMLQDDIGALEVGKKTDIILVNHQGPHTRPTYNLWRTLVMFATPQGVTDVVMDGVVLMRGRAFTQEDETEIIEKATEPMQRVARRAGF